MIDEIQKNLLREVADLDSLPVGAYNIRANGEKAAMNGEVSKMKLGKVEHIV